MGMSKAAQVIHNPGPQMQPPQQEEEGGESLQALLNAHNASYVPPNRQS